VQQLAFHQQMQLELEQQGLQQELAELEQLQVQPVQLHQE
jgi:hypothetical protein